MNLELSIPAHTQQNRIKHHRFNMQFLQRAFFFFFFSLLATWPLLESAPLDVSQWHSMVKDEAGVKEHLCLLWSSLCTSEHSCLSTVQSVLTWKVCQGNCKIKHLAFQPLHTLELWHSLLSSLLFLFNSYLVYWVFFSYFRGGKRGPLQMLLSASMSQWQWRSLSTTQNQAISKDTLKNWRKAPKYHHPKNKKIKIQY